MNRLTSLSLLFRVVAIVELLYAAVGLLTPPSMVFAVTGWTLSPDGQWVTKLLAVALGSQAWVAWTLRNNPQSGVAADQGVFATTAAKVGVLASIPTHYVLGTLLVVALRSASRRVAIPTPALARG
jgi:hypothetical protein